MKNEDTKNEIPTNVRDATTEMLDVAVWVRGFYVALRLAGFNASEAMLLTKSAVNGLLEKQI